MKYRIGGWATAGFLVASFWALFLYPTTPMGSTSILTLVRLTCPVAFAEVGLRFYWVLIANAATYALIGVVVEVSRCQVLRKFRGLLG